MSSSQDYNSALIAAALLATNPELAAGVDAQDTWAAEIAEQGARVDLYRKYVEGEHRSGITDQMRNMLRLPEDDTGLTDFTDNYCEVIVSKMASRLEVMEIATGQEGIDKQWLLPLIKRNSWQALQGKVFSGAVRDGTAFIMVDPQTLMWTNEPAYDGFSGVVVIFDTAGSTPIWACKLWNESVGLGDSSTATPMRLIVYEPNRISYWHGESGGKEVLPDQRVEMATPGGTQQGNVLPWPVGKVPLVAFTNKSSNYASTGQSEIRPAIPLQDVLNRTLHSMVMASEFSAFRVKWSIGMEINAAQITPGAIIGLVLKDASGNIITEMSPELVEFMKAVRVGEFEETDISQYIQQIDKLAREVSQISQTPIYGVTTEGVLSGEALKQLEIGLIGKVERFQKDNTDSVRELIRLTALLQNTFVTEFGLAPTELGEITPVWKSAELLDAVAQITVLISMRKDAPGLWDDDFYRGRIGALLGMSQAAIEKETLKAQAASTNIMDSLIGAGGNIPVVA